MILSTHGIIQSSGAVVFDSDYEAVLTYATSLGYTLPSLSQRNKQNQLMLDLKAGGIWNKLDTFVVFATDGNSNFALIDWKRLSLYTAVNSPTFTTNGGFAGNGTSSYINTQFAGSVNGINLTLNNASRFYWVDNRVGSLWEGLDTSSGHNSGNSSASSHIINSSNNSFTGGNVNFAVDEWHSICKDTSLTIVLFTNTTRFDRTLTSTSLSSIKQVIGKRNTTFNATRFRAYGMGASLISENTAFYNALNTYLTSL